MNIVTINGAPIADTKTPCAYTVRICEDLLEKARSGEIQGIAAVTQNHDQTVTRHTAGIFTTTRVLGSLMVLIHKITHTKADDDGEGL